MFSKAKPPAEAGREGMPAVSKTTARTSGVPSIVSPDLEITGNLNSRGDVQVDGVVSGDVTADSLTIGEQGRVRGAIRAETVKVCGEVVGEIEGGTVTLAATAKVEGDIVHDRLAIEPGAHLEGHCRRRGAAQGAKGTTGAASAGAGSTGTAATKSATASGTNGAASDTRGMAS